MINEERAKAYCREDLSKIENYDEAIADKTQTWDCHHKLEIQGRFKNSKKLLIRCGLYYGVPAWQLVFMTQAEHRRLHSSNMSEDTRQKLSEAHRGKRLPEDTKQKISESSKGRPKSEETKRKMSEASKEFWRRRKAKAQ